MPVPPLSVAFCFLAHYAIPIAYEFILCF